MIDFIWHQIYFDKFNNKQNFFVCFKSTQGGEITVHGLTEIMWQVSSVGLHVEKHRHDYRLKYPLGRQDQKQHE